MAEIFGINPARHQSRFPEITDQHGGSFMRSFRGDQTRRFRHLYIKRHTRSYRQRGQNVAPARTQYPLFACFMSHVLFEVLECAHIRPSTRTNATCSKRCGHVCRTRSEFIPRHSCFSNVTMTDESSRLLTVRKANEKATVSFDASKHAFLHPQV